MLSLQEICRVCIRRILRPLIEAENPGLVRLRARPAPRPRPRRCLTPRGRHVNIMPMNVGMMILGRYAADSSIDDDDDDDEEGEGREQEPGSEEGVVRARYRSSDAADEGENGREAGTVMEGDEDEDERRVAQQMFMRRPRFEVTRYNITRPPPQIWTKNKDSSESEEGDHGFEDAKGDIDDVKADTGDAGKSAEGNTGGGQDVATGGMEEEEEESSAAIPIRQRYSSSASVSAASYTSSGLGTCSSVEEPCDFPREVLTEAAVIEEAPEPTKLPAHACADEGDILDLSSLQNLPSTTPAAESERGAGAADSEGLGTFQVERTGPRPPNIFHRFGIESDESMDYEEDSDDNDDDNDDDDDSEDSMLAVASECQVDEEEEVKSVIGSGYSLHMHEKIAALPVPLPIKQFLMFYRT
jgi:hypothetical protein